MKKLLVISAFLLAIVLPASVSAAPFTIDNNPADTPAPPESQTTLWITQADNLKNAVVLDTFGGGQQGAFMCRTARGTGGTPQALKANDYMCTMQAWGYDGTSYAPRPGGSVAIRTADDWKPGSHPTWFKVELTQRGSTENILPMIVTPEGHWGHSINSRTSAPSLSDCGTNPKWVEGDDNGARITVGSGANNGKCVVNFAQEWKYTNREGGPGNKPTAPGCTANNETSPYLLRAAKVTSKKVELTGTLNPGDSINFDCRQLTNG